MIKKVYIPKYLFTLSRVASSVVNVMASFCALIVVMVFSGIELNFTVLLLVVPMGILIIFSTGIGLLFGNSSRKIQRYHPFIWGIDYCINLFDTGYLSDFYLAGKNTFLRRIKSADRNFKYV